MVLTKHLAMPLSLSCLIAVAATSTYAAEFDHHEFDLPPNSQAEAKEEIKFDTTNDTIKTRKKKLAQSAYKKALQLKSEGNIGSALLELMKAVNNNPLLLDAYYQQALIFKEQGLHKLASSRLEQALAIDPEFKDARILLATIAIEQGNLHKAFNQLGKSLQNTSKNDSDKENETALLALQKENSKVEEQKIESQKDEPSKKRKLFKRKKKKSKKNKRISRAKIRKAIARRYRKFHKTYKKPRHNQPWYTKYTRLIGWANPFKVANNPDTESSQADFREDYDDLVPRGQKRIGSKKPLLAKAKKLSSFDQSKSENDKALDRLFNQAKVNDIEMVAPILELGNLDESPEETKSTQNKLTYSDENSSSLKSNQIASSYSQSEKKEAGVKEETSDKEDQRNLLFQNFEGNRLLKSSITSNTSSVGFLKEQEPEKQESKNEPFKPPINDKWTKKLIALNKNGTGTLKRGEAFMFSEDTGEAVLFLSGGRRIRRIIAPTQSSERVVKLRRPDVLVPKELFYDFSLLGKVIGQKPKHNKPSVPYKTKTKDSPPTFHMEKIMDESRTFVGTIRDVLRL